MALNLTLKVHPVVLFQIVDAYERRNVDAYRVIGTLLGTVEKGVVIATNSFCVPHKEHKEIVEAELVYAKDMYELNQQVIKQEVIVGWWATGNTVTSHSSVIHEYYSRECNNPVHMTLDTTLQKKKLDLQAFVNVRVGVPGSKLGSCFTPIPVEVICYEPEVTSLRLCQKTIAVDQKCVPPTDDLERIVEAADKLKVLIDSVLSYVEEVILGKREPDNEIGRTLLDMVHSVPKMSTEQFQNMFNTNVKDLLMVLSLAQLVHTQLQLNEKLTFLSTM